MLNHTHLHPIETEEREVAEPQSREALLMTPVTPFAILADRCGLSQREASEFLKVRIDTVKSWCAGRNAAKPVVLAELRGLYQGIEAAAAGMSKTHEALLKTQVERGIQQRAIGFGIAETDDVARAYGFPSLGPYMAAVGLAMSKLPADVDIFVRPQSYPGTGGGASAPVFPGTTLTWPPKRPPVG